MSTGMRMFVCVVVGGVVPDVADAGGEAQPPEGASAGRSPSPQGANRKIALSLRQAAGPKVHSQHAASWGFTAFTSVCLPRLAKAAAWRDWMHFARTVRTRGAVEAGWA